MGIKGHKYEAILLLGGNIGNVRQTFNQVDAELQKYGQVQTKSSLYETEAWGMDNAPQFLNQVIIFNTDLNPQELLSTALSIESGLGRIRNDKPFYSSREIDIDILFYEEMVMEHEDLIIPHPKVHLRKFALLPLKEIAPDFVHPIQNKTISQLLKEVKDNLEVNRLDE